MFLREQRMKLLVLMILRNTFSLILNTLKQKLRLTNDQICMMMKLESKSFLTNSKKQKKFSKKNWQQVGNLFEKPFLILILTTMDLSQPKTLDDFSDKMDNQLNSLIYNNLFSTRIKRKSVC